MPLFYVINAERRSLHVRVEVNGVPVILWETPAPRQAFDQLNGWITPGTNEVRIRLEWPADQTYAPETGQFRMRLEAVEKGKKVGSGQALAEIEWPDALQPEAYPFETLMRFQAPETPPAELWTKARPFEFNDEMRNTVIDTVSSLHQALSARDRSNCMKLLEYKTVDIRRAFHISPDEGRKDLKELLEMLFDVDDWAMAPLEVERLEMHVVGGNRLVWVTLPDYATPLRTAAESSAGFSLPVYLAPIDGRWTIVR